MGNKYKIVLLCGYEFWQLQICGKLKLESTKNNHPFSHETIVLYCVISYKYNFYL